MRSAGPGRNDSHQEWTGTALASAAEAIALSTRGPTAALTAPLCFREALGRYRPIHRRLVLVGVAFLARRILACLETGPVPAYSLALVGRSGPRYLHKY